MVQNNKVLTVSYGTFSCTLEGFEDSFGTMKAIAEYFRDLASDDRYFGAEPPQPDADMLARIAQREVARQVEARTSSEGIHLRAAAPALTPDVAAAPVSGEPVSIAAVSEASVSGIPADRTEAVQPAPAQKVSAPDTAPSENAEEDTIAPENLPETVIAGGQAADSIDLDLDLSTVDLFEEDSASASEATSDIATTTAPDITDALVTDALVQESSPAENVVEEPARAESQAASVDMQTIAAISAAVALNDSEAEDTPVTSAIEVFEPEEAPRADRHVEDTDTVPAVDSIAAKLQRIRAVVAQTPQDEFSEDEHAEAFVEAAAAELSQDEDDDGIFESAFADDDEISRALDLLDLNGDLSQDAEESDHAEVDHTLLGDDNILFSDTVAADMGSAETNRDQPTRRARIARLKKLSPEEPAAVEVGELAAKGAETPTASDSSADTDAPAGLPRARIVKVKRSDLEKAIAAGGLQEITDGPETSGEDDATDQPETDRIQSTLDEADEADLLRELAEVEADLLASTQEDPALKAIRETGRAQVDHQADHPVAKDAQTAAPSETPTATNANDTADYRPATPSPDSDVSRLLAAAETKLGDPDNATSRETYSHLRAAVAAAEADRTTGSGAAIGDESEPYREDLANVVRPRRPGAGSAATPPHARIKGSRPAPLKLVAEQRIDAVSVAPAEPVRPRRISVLEEETTPQQKDLSGTFADYAQDRGAVELHELLEAAAAYMSFVEGRDHFSRPQLMNKVRSMGNGDFNREDGLRSFGQLLRDGKIERAENGRFAATEEIGFRPAKRAAG